MFIDEADEDPGVEKGRLGLLRPHVTGEIYIQEATSMLPARVLQEAFSSRVAAADGGGLDEMRILDLCAAPGSKATQMGSWLHGRGLLVANEPDLERARMLKTNLLKSGIANFLVTALDGRYFGTLTPSAFDGVLVDAPCSSEGNLRKHGSKLVDSFGSSLHIRKRRERVWLQHELVESAWEALRPGGYLVYSTCTLNAYENEAQCRRLLRKMPDAEKVDVPSLLGLPPSLRGRGAASLSIADDGYLRVWPSDYDTEGFFVSCFRKRTDSSAAAPATTQTGAAASDPEYAGEGYEGIEGLGHAGSAWGSPVDGEEAARVQAAAMRELGFWPRAPAMTLQVVSQRSFRLVPEVGLDLHPLADYSFALGVEVATGSSGGGPLSLRVSDELLLLAGEQATLRSRSMSEADWVALAAKVGGSIGLRATQMDLEAQAGNAEAAQNLFDDMVASDLLPNTRSYNVLMNAYACQAQHNSAAKAKGVLEEMLSNWVSPDITSFNVVLKAMAASGKGSEAQVWHGLRGQPRPRERGLETGRDR